MPPAKRRNPNPSTGPTPAESPTQPRNELFDFMEQVGDTMAKEYKRIRRRSREDPGTAGDEGENNWAKLLREWLPRSYHVVTKGRVIGFDGRASKQLDVLVLKPTYPPKLLDTKTYLAGGVAAAFECKLTLRPEHLPEAFENCLALKKLYPPRVGTPFLELHTPVVFGVLAHSCRWPGKKEAVTSDIELRLLKSDREHVTHPRHILDLLCISDRAFWGSMITVSPLLPHHYQDRNLLNIEGLRGTPGTVYGRALGQTPETPPSPIGALLATLTKKLAWDDPSYRSVAEYYANVNIGGNSGGMVRRWPPQEVYSPKLQAALAHAPVQVTRAWGEWDCGFP